ncbi:hypothetical protein [Desulfosoma caldarium]|uniref:Uncharacterized protein n=1 Tax=Desulfosoma caldarium TaxID=610254 RepID=A0A3N1VPQ4_9BACT|nr:hypothetical protein [Desulfosoma caldarium]ROR03031.1 hypothetical protein EDC27_0286 [Desulfosoma caldarium]
MTWPEAVRLFQDVVTSHPVSLTLALLTAASLGAVYWMRRRLRRHWHSLLEEASEEPFRLLEESSLSEKDRAALSYLKALRQKVWSMPDQDISLSLDTFFSQAQDIVHTIASIYHPDKAEAQYEASLKDVLALCRRTTSRLEAVVQRGPFRLLSSRPIGHYRALYKTYRRVNASSLVQSLKKHPMLYKAAQVMWHAKNWKNPFYWVSRELSRESLRWLVRWFTIAMINQVGKEAMRLYGQHGFADDEERDLVLACLKLHSLCTSQKSGQREGALRAWVAFVCDVPVLDPAAKIRILRQAIEKGVDDVVMAESFRTRRGESWYKRGLHRLGESSP